jgi:signal transduction histidine kinase
MNNKIQFDDRNIVDTFERINVMDEESRNTSIYFIDHELRGSQAGIFGFSDLLINNCQLTNFQKEYVSKIRAYSNILSETITNTTKGCIRKYIPESKQELIENAQIIMTGIEALVQHSPVTEKVLKLAPLSKDETDYLNIINIVIEDTIYLHNQHFSPNSQKDEYHLDKDTKLYVRNHNKKTMVSAEIELKKMHRTITRFDYFTKVVLPLLQNINDHAYDPKNDINNRLNQPDFKKKIEIFSEVEPSKEELKIYIKDNGFGVSPKIIDKLFNEGASGRENPEGHGLGLWLVKKFVEQENGGTIDFDTKLGEGTKFHFTIPYDRKTAGIFIKN